MFYLLCASQLITLLGSELTKFAIPIWLYQKGGSAAAVTLAFAFSFLPRLILGPFVGTWVDLSSRKKLLILSEAGQALTIGLLIIATQIFPEGTKLTSAICALLFFQSLFNLFQNPGISAITADLMPEQKLQTANSLLSIMDSSALILGPIAAGFLLSLVNLGSLLYFDVLSFALSILILAFLPRDARPLRVPVRQLLSETIEGFRQLRRRPSIARFILLGAGLNFALSLSMGLLNPFLTLLFNGNTERVGFANGTAGACEIVGAMAVLLLPVIRRRIKFQLHCLLGIAVLGLATLAMANGWLMATAGLSMIFFLTALMNTVNRTAWQVAVGREELGRFFATKRTISNAFAPAGFALSGWICDGIWRRSLGVPELTSFRLMFTLSALTLLAIFIFNFKSSWVEVWDEKNAR